MPVPKVTRCPTCKRRLTRSSEANRRLWALLHLLSEKLKVKGETYSPETWHTYLKSRFLGCEEFTLPNGKVLQIPHSTAGLDVGQFADYMTQCEVFANEHGVYFEDAMLA